MLMSSPLVLLDEDEAGWWVLLEAIVGQHLNMSGTVEEVGEEPDCAAGVGASRIFFYLFRGEIRGEMSSRFEDRKKR